MKASDPDQRRQTIRGGFRLRWVGALSTMPQGLRDGPVSCGSKAIQAIEKHLPRQ